MTFNPFTALYSNDAIIEFAKIQLRYFALETNSKTTREEIVKSLNEHFLKIHRLYYFGCICDGSNNDPELIDENKLAVYIEYKLSSISPLKRYNIVMGPKKWDKSTADYFAETDFTDLFTDLEFSVQELTL